MREVGGSTTFELNLDAPWGWIWWDESITAPTANGAINVARGPFCWERGQGHSKVRMF
jgi:hypothetical protein